MPSAVPILPGISAAELRPRAKIEPDGRAPRMLALAAALDGASCEAAARQAGMTFAGFTVSIDSHSVIPITARHRHARLGSGSS